MKLFIIPDSAAEIRDYAFALCKSLKEITIPCLEMDVIKIRFPGDTIGMFSKEALETMFQK